MCVLWTLVPILCMASFVQMPRVSGTIRKIIHHRSKFRGPVAHAGLPHYSLHDTHTYVHTYTHTHTHTHTHTCTHTYAHKHTHNVYVCVQVNCNGCASSDGQNWSDNWNKPVWRVCQHQSQHPHLAGGRSSIHWCHRGYPPPQDHKENSANIASSTGSTHRYYITHPIYIVSMEKAALFSACI